MKITIRNFPRMDDAAVRDMAKGIVTGQRWIYEDDHSSAIAAMWLTFTDITPAAIKLIGAVVGDCTSSVRSLNGQPMTFSGWLVHREDWPKVLEKWKTIEEAMQ